MHVALVQPVNVCLDSDPMSAPVTSIQKADVLSLDEIICATVRALRSARQAEVPVLASFIGVSRGSFYNRLNGTSQFAAAEIGMLAQFFDVPVTDFYEGIVRVGPKAVSPVTTARYVPPKRHLVAVDSQVTDPVAVTPREVVSNLSPNRAIAGVILRTNPERTSQCAGAA